MRKALLSALLTFAVAAPAAAQYTIIELPPPPGNSTSLPTAAYGISESGYVAGSVGSGAAERPVRWTVVQSAVTQTLDLGAWGVAYGVNSSGKVVGTIQGTQAFLWQPNAVPPLKAVPGVPDLPNGRCVAAYAISDANNVTGFFSPSVSGGAVAHPGWAFLWRTTDKHALLRPDPDARTTVGSSGYAISQSTVAGYAEAEDGAMEAYLWQGGWQGRLFDLPGPGWSRAFGINDLGFVVGESNGQAVRFTPLGSLGVIGAARDVNDHEVIVGYATQPAAYAFRHAGGVTQNLNDLLPPGSDWQLLAAYGINDAGWIVGVGRKGVVSDPGGGAGEAEAGDAVGAGEPGGPSGGVIRGFVLIPPLTEP